jgi:SOS-response transcriptional repressor LexA
VTLRPANAALAPMRYSAARVRIQGVVVGQFRSYR